MTSMLSYLQVFLYTHYSLRDYGRVRFTGISRMQKLGNDYKGFPLANERQGAQFTLSLIDFAFVLFRKRFHILSIFTQREINIFLAFYSKDINVHFKNSFVVAFPSTCYFIQKTVFVIAFITSCGPFLCEHFAFSTHFTLFFERKKPPRQFRKKNR